MGCLTVTIGIKWLAFSSLEGTRREEKTQSKHHMTAEKHIVEARRLPVPSFA
jgi:hypothetical protein